MARKQNGLAMQSSIEPTLGAPLDGRQQVKLNSDLTDPASYPYSYVTMTVGSREDGRLYCLQAKDTTKEENWEKIAFLSDLEGQGGGSTDNAVEITAAEVAALFNS